MKWYLADNMFPQKIISFNFSYFFKKWILKYYFIIYYDKQVGDMKLWV